MENQNSSFQYWMPVRILFTEAEPDIREEIAGESVVIVTDPFLYESGVAGRTGDRLGNADVSYFSKVEPNPSTDTVNACAAMIREHEAKTVIGIGGGSSMDTAKAAACLASSGGVIGDYAGKGKSFGKRTVRLILIPTTAGTGSEVTNVGVYTDSETGEKRPVVCPEFYADLAVIHPKYTYTMPRSVTANTGMDAFCHAIEAYWNLNSQPISDSFAVQAMKLILDNLLTAYRLPEDGAARENLCTASLLAGLAFGQTRTTGAHVLSYPLTARYHVPHGTGCAVSLPAFIRISVEKAGKKMQTLAEALGYIDVEALADGVCDLMRSLEMPVALREIGAKAEELSGIAKDAMNYYPQLSLTPAFMTEVTVFDLLKSIY